MPNVLTAAGTVGGLVAQATARLEAAGMTDARREALRLVGDCLGWSPSRAWLEREQPVSEAAAARVHHAIERRSQGEPLAYVAGFTAFRHLTIRTDARALIPRPETEGLVDLVLSRRSEGTVADIGTGTGCIALSLAREGRFDRIVAVDASEAALALARENRSATGLPIALLRGDLVGPLESGSIDVLVSNPPYISAPEYDTLDPSVRDYEPVAALLSGEDGLDATRRLLIEGRRVMRPGGLLALELAADRAEASAELARGYEWGDVAVHEDWFGRPRFLTAAWGGMNDRG